MNKTFAIVAAMPSIPLKPIKPATIAIIKNVNDQYNIYILAVSFYHPKMVYKKFSFCFKHFQMRRPLLNIFLALNFFKG